jgi:hypothetical protein
MKINRRKFIQSSAIISTGVMLGKAKGNTLLPQSEKFNSDVNKPVVIST